MKSRGNVASSRLSDKDKEPDQAEFERDEMQRQSNGDEINHDMGSDGADNLQPLREDQYYFVMQQERYL